MENLLEEEFVIENCTLPQRAAIKAYCDEKGIAYHKDYFDNPADYSEYKHIRFYENGEWKFVGTSSADPKVVTFKEVIQALEDYQAKPKFKAGDFIVAEGSTMRIKVRKITGCEVKKGNLNWNERDWDDGFEHSYRIESCRFATPEEIAKWKEDNENKLPIIGGYDGKLIQNGEVKSINYGCTDINVNTIKELYEAGMTGLVIKGIDINTMQLDLIMKCINHKEKQ